MFDRKLPGGAAAPTLLPGASWRDLGAGLCVAGLLLPEAVAYAGLAHLPVVHALSAAIVGLALYALFGGSRFAIVSPTSSAAVLSAAAVGSLGLAPGDGAYTQALLALTATAGAMLLLLGFAGQGQLSAFVSRPVLRGYAFALALTIVVKQLPDVLGLHVPGPGDPLDVLLFAGSHLRQWQLPSMAVALAAGLGVLLLRRWARLPASMIVMVLAIAAAWAFDLAGLGVAEVGLVPPPTWRLSIPGLPWADWLRVGELAAGLVVLVFAESWGSARSLALAHGETVDANRELLVLGACNLGAALCQGMPVGAGFSGTSANAAAGAGSRWAGAAALGVVALVVAWALPALRFLPRPVLAVAVINALWHALSLQPLRAVWRVDRDRLSMAGAVVAVLLLGVLGGMLAAIALSLATALRRFSQPVVHELGRLGDSHDFVVLGEHDDVATAPGLMVLRPEAPLFFASAERVVTAVMASVGRRGHVGQVVLSLEESADLDGTAAECLLELDRLLHAGGRRLLLARVKGGVRELLSRIDPQGLGHADRLFWSVADAVRAAQQAVAAAAPSASPAADSR